MVVLDKQDCINTAQDWLAQMDIYRPLAADPTKKHKNKHINIYKTIKAGRTRGLYPIGAGPQNL